MTQPTHPNGWYSRGYLPHLDTPGLLQSITFRLADSLPNHVHVVVETMAGFPLARVVQSWKTFSARESNRRLERSGRFWARDYFDRYIRDDRHLRAVLEYFENNPVKAGLVARSEDWRFGSAWRRAMGLKGV